MKQLITKNFLDGITLPETGDVIVRDTAIPGFGVRLSPGRASFFVQRKMGGSTSVKRTLGSYPTMTVVEARKQAPIWLGTMAGGKDPLLLRREQQVQTQAEMAKLRRTFDKVFDDYAEFKRDSSANLTVRDREKTRKKLDGTALARTPFEEVTFEVVDQTLAPMFKAHLATAWRVYRYCRAAYALEAEKSKIAGNPFSHWRKRKKPPLVQRRQELLPTDELSGQKWLRALNQLRGDPRFSVNVTADYLLCLLLWGGRKTETQMLRRQDIDFENKLVVFRGDNTKNKRDHWFPLTPWAEEIIRSRMAANGDGQPWVFPSRVKGKHVVDIRNVLEELRDASGLTIRAHDLRRTFASELSSDSDANLFVVKTAMNHAATAQDVTVGYIAIKSKVNTLRPIYEVRERRLMHLSGLKVKAQKVPTKLSPMLRAAARDPALRALLLEELTAQSSDI